MARTELDGRRPEPAGAAGAGSAGSIRPARPDDLPGLLGCVRELAEYERAADRVEATEAALGDALFPAGRAPAVFALVAEVAGEVVGCAVWFESFSTWAGRHGIYLEDLYVRAEHRGRGLGRALLGRLAALCVERGGRRLEWAVLDWNAPARRFYASLGAVAMDEWTVHRLDGEALRRLGAGAAS